MGRVQSRRKSGDTPKHFVAVTANKEKAERYGFPLKIFIQSGNGLEEDSRSLQQRASH